MSNQKVRDAVENSVRWTVFDAVNGSVCSGMPRAVFRVFNDAAYWAVRDALRRALEGDPEHPTLSSFLYEITYSGEV